MVTRAEGSANVLGGEEATVGEPAHGGAEGSPAPLKRYGALFGDFQCSLLEARPFVGVPRESGNRDSIINGSSKPGRWRTTDPSAEGGSDAPLSVPGARKTSNRISDFYLREFLRRL